MNSGKKAIKGEIKTKVKKNTTPTFGIGKKISVGIVSVLVIIILAAVMWEGMAPKYLLAFDGEKLKKEDFMYDIYQAEGIGSQMAQMYAQFGYTEDYFTMDNGDGTTTQDTLRQQTIDSYVYNRVLYGAAVEAGYKETEEEKKKAAETAEKEIKMLTEKKAKKLGLTKENITERELQETVVARYKQDKVDAFDIDDAGIKAGVDYDTYRGYELEYFFVPTTETNEAGENVAVTDKEALRKELQTVFEKAGSGDWSKVIDSKDEKAVVKYGTKTITKEEEAFPADLTSKLMAMNNNEIMDIVEAEDGYYAFRMVNNDSPEQYNTKVEESISAEEEAQFKGVYEELKAKYEIKEYDKNWKSIVFGTVTL
ncbi:MAG: hypothetical protein RSB37_01500 [Acetivibrio sp.]